MDAVGVCTSNEIHKQIIYSYFDFWIMSAKGFWEKKK